MTRVAYVCADPDIAVFGSAGSSVHAQEVLAALRRAGADVHLFAARLGGEPPPALRGLPIEWLPCPVGDPAARERGLLQGNDVLSAELARCGPFDLVYERHSVWSFAGMEHAAEAGVPGVLEVNAPLVEEQRKQGVLVDAAAAAGVSQRAFAAASALFAVTRPLADWLEAQPGAAGRVHVVPNAVDPARFPAGLLPSRPAPLGVFTVGFMGRLKPGQGLEVLAESYASMQDVRPGFRLLIVGDGPARADLEAHLAARGITEGVEITGQVPPAEVPALLASMDVAVAPYRAQAGFHLSPLKIYELMAAGLPVVASRLPALEEAIEDGVNGLLCAPGDASAFAAALLDLADKPSLRASLGRSARRAVLAGHTWARVADRILAFARERTRGPAPDARPRPPDEWVTAR